MPQKDITIYDLAEQLNISATTVSRGLQNHPAINEKTRKRISDLAAELGYRSNKFASNLRKQKTNTLGVIVPRLNSLFMSSVISGIERIANNAGYNLIISQSFEKEAKEQTNAKTMFNSRVDGLIVSLSSDTKDYSHFGTFIKKNIPVIFFDRIAEEVKSAQVLIDNFKAGYAVTAHLIAQGCKEILHITGNTTRNVYRDRMEGYQKALSDHNIMYQPDLVISNDLSEQAIKDTLVNDILKRQHLPDGLFITNDSAAAVALSVLREAGLRVPEDIALAGFNNDLISRVTEPAITTINYPGNEMGENIARILINHLDGEGKLSFTNTVVLDAELIIRASSIKNRNK